MNRISDDDIVTLRWDQDPGRRATVELTPGSFPSGVVSDGTNIWVTNSVDPGSVSQIDPTTGTVIDTITVGTAPSGIAYDGTTIWVVNQGSNDVSKIDPNDGSVVDTVDVGVNPAGIAFDGTNVWVTNAGSDTVSKLLPS